MVGGGGGGGSKIVPVSESVQNISVPDANIILGPYICVFQNLQSKWCTTCE